MTTGRVWLNSAIEMHYLPAIARVKKSPKGKATLLALFEQMRSDWTNRGLAKLGQQKSLLSAVRKAIKEHLGQEHWSLDIINFSTDEWVEANLSTLNNLVARNESVKFLDDPDKITAIAVRLIEQSPEWADIVAGLSLLTGRRAAELLSTATFVKLSHWSVLFSGAVKRGEEALVFEIPTLTTADRVIKALDKVRRELPDAVNLSPRVINQKYEAAVIRACDKHFGSVIPLREGKDSLYTHINRAVYAAIAVFWFCPPAVQEVEFKAQIQGHFQVLDAPDEPTRRSLVSARHYSDYEISDRAIALQGGKRKGIKLGHGGIVPIEVFDKAWKAEGEVGEGERRRRESISLRIFKDSLGRWNTLLNAIAPDGETQQQRMDGLLAWAEQRLGQMGEMTVEMEVEVPALVDELEQMVVPERMAIAPLNPLPDVTDQLQSIIEAMVQQQVQQFLSSAGLSSMQSFVMVQNGAATGADKPKGRGRGTSSEATIKVDRVINAIMNHNDVDGRRHDDKWEVTIRSVKALGCSQSVVYRVFETRADDIQAHHSKHQIQSGHNARHRGKNTINQVISL